MKTDFFKIQPQPVIPPRRLNKKNLVRYLRTHTWFLDKKPFLKGKAAIDVGCGDGIFLAYLKTKLKLGRIVGLDIDPLKCRMARKKNPKTKIIEANAEKIPFKNNSFDFVFVNAVLHHTKNYCQVVDELVRICKDKGLIVILEPRRLHPTIFFLSLLKQEERGQLKLDLKKLLQFLKKKKTVRKIELFPVNSFIYPYQRFPPLLLFEIVSKIEDFFKHPYFSTHQAIVFKINK